MEFRLPALEKALIRDSDLRFPAGSIPVFVLLYLAHRFCTEAVEEKPRCPLCGFHC